jgi:hypothetical protein
MVGLIMAQEVNFREITAIANYLYPKIKAKVRESNKQKLRNYQPSETFIKLKAMFQKIEFLDSQRESLLSQIESVQRDICDILYDEYDYTDSPFTLKEDHTFDLIKNKESGIIEAPNIDQITDDVIIASMNDDFSVKEFIKEELSKF